MMDALKRYEDTTEVKYFRRYDFENVHKTFHTRQKKRSNKNMTTLLTHNAVVSNLMENKHIKE